MAVPDAADEFIGLNGVHQLDLKKAICLSALAGPVLILVIGIVGADLAVLASIRGILHVEERFPIALDTEIWMVAAAPGENYWTIITITNLSDLYQPIEIEAIITPVGENLTPGELTVTYSIDWVPLADSNGNGMPDMILEPNEVVEIELMVEASWSTAPGTYAIKTNILREVYYTLTTSVSPPGAGSISVSPSGTRFVRGTEVTLTATANTGYIFDHWSGDASGTSQTVAVTMDRNRTVVANFIEGYLITNVQQLQGMKDNLTARYILANDIDASETASWSGGAGFLPVGTSSAPFTGIFEGRGHVIENLFINRPGANYVGLFGYIGSGVVEDVGLLNENVIGNNYVGGLAGLSDGTISSSYSGSSVTGNGVVGGLVGQNNGTVENSYSTASVSGGNGNYVGGLVGRNYDNGLIIRSYSAGPVTGGSNVGGLVGQNDGMISNSYSTGSVSGGWGVGGLVGQHYSGMVLNSYSTGFVTSEYGAVGGLIGSGRKTIAFNSASSASTSHPFPSSLSWSHTTSGENRILFVTVSMDSSRTVTGVTYGGQTLTKLRRDTLSVSSTEIWYMVAPPLGTNTVTVTFSSTGVYAVCGAISYTGVDQVRPIDTHSGATGYGTTASASVTVSTPNSWVMAVVNSYASSITGVSGGVYRYGPRVSAGVNGAAADKNAPQTTGPKSISFTRSSGDPPWAMSIVSIRPAAGVSGSFWDILTSGRTTSSGGEGKTTAEMRTLSTFSSAGWDIALENDYFDETWYIDENNDYPRLGWQLGRPPGGEVGFLIGDFEDNSYDYWTAGTAPVGQPVNRNASRGSWSFAYRPPAGFPPDGKRFMLHVSASEGPMAGENELVAIYLSAFEEAKVLKIDVVMDNTEWDFGTAGYANLLEAVVIMNDNSSWQQINIPTGVKEWSSYGTVLGEHPSGTFSFEIDFVNRMVRCTFGDTVKEGSFTTNIVKGGNTWTKLLLLPMYGNVTTAGNFYFDSVRLIW